MRRDRGKKNNIFLSPLNLLLGSLWFSLSCCRVSQGYPAVSGAEETHLSDAQRRISGFYLNKQTSQAAIIQSPSLLLFTILL